MQDHLSPYALPKQLHSSEQGLLQKPPCRWARSVTACTHALSFMAHTLWNRLPGEVRKAPLAWLSANYAEISGSEGLFYTGNRLYFNENIQNSALVKG